MQNRSQAAIIALIHDLRPNLPLTAISLGNPHDLEVVVGANAYIAAYGTSPTIAAHVAKILTGALSAHGSLPIKLALEERERQHSTSQ